MTLNWRKSPVVRHTSLKHSFKRSEKCGCREFWKRDVSRMSYNHRRISQLRFFWRRIVFNCQIVLRIMHRLTLSFLFQMLRMLRILLPNLSKKNLPISCHFYELGRTKSIVMIFIMLRITVSKFEHPSTSSLQHNQCFRTLKPLRWTWFVRAYRDDRI